MRSATNGAAMAAGPSWMKEMSPAASRATHSVCEHERGDPGRPLGEVEAAESEQQAPEVA
jgi:hypothetical protein